MKREFNVLIYQQTLRCVKYVIAVAGNYWSVVNIMAKFTEEQLDALFAIDDIGKFLTNRYPPTQERLINIYDSICYPLCTKSTDDGFYHCMIHQPFKNIYFSSFLHHILTTEPKKHKEYIHKILFKK